MGSRRVCRRSAGTVCRVTAVDWGDSCLCERGVDSARYVWDVIACVCITIQDCISGSVIKELMSSCSSCMYLLGRAVEVLYCITQEELAAEEGSLVTR
jgi:hypothetical protein